MDQKIDQVLLLLQLTSHSVSVIKIAHMPPLLSAVLFPSKIQAPGERGRSKVLATTYWDIKATLSPTEVSCWCYPTLPISTWRFARSKGRLWPRTFNAMYARFVVPRSFVHAAEQLLPGSFSSGFGASESFASVRKLLLPTPSHIVSKKDRYFNCWKSIFNCSVFRGSCLWSSE